MRFPLSSCNKSYFTFYERGLLLYRRFLTSPPFNFIQVKGDYGRAEEYYSRAILADPNDGELLSVYAKLVWDVHRDGERASSYFEQAARASPQNRCVHFTPSNPYTVLLIRAWILIACFVHVCSHVLAAHAAFLWDTDDGDGPEDCSSDALGYAGFAPALSSLASATT
jgi:tetratricopeptide (TPR) repeat protein